jgi:AcrR family transcriptional regulator
MRADKVTTEIRQEQIARAATRLLAVRGWQQVSLAAVAKAVGIVPSAVYRHFSGKDQMLDAVLDLVDQSFQTNLRAARRATTNPVTRLKQALMQHAELIRSGVPIPRIILCEDVFTGSPRHRKRVKAIYQTYLGEIAAIIRDGQDQNLIRPELAADTLALMWLGLVQTPAILWLVIREGFDLRQHCERAWQLFAETIQPSRPNKPGMSLPSSHHENRN